jgi:hypothetical protein
MNRKRVLWLSALLTVGFLATILSLTAASDDSTVLLPGITTKDEHPNGCVDCHSKQGDKDYRLNTLPAQIKGHPDISKIVKKVPNDCTFCHKGSGKAAALANALHKVHFQDPAKNAFVTVYKGLCLNCHQLDLATGAMKVKSAPANW